MIDSQSIFPFLNEDEGTVPDSIISEVPSIIQVTLDHCATVLPRRTAEEVKSILSPFILEFFAKGFEDYLQFFTEFTFGAGEDLTVRVVFDRERMGADLTAFALNHISSSSHCTTTP